MTAFHSSKPAKPTAVPPRSRLADRVPARPATPKRGGGETPVRIGIAGLGRSGWDIHADALARVPERFRIVAAADGVAARRDEAAARFGCAAYDTVDALLADPQLEAVVIATPNLLHAEHAIAALGRGLHVVAEKPMAMSLAEADAMIDAAHRADRLLAPFQNRRFEAGYLKVRELMDSGVLGRVVHIRMCWHQFTRRWDWQVIRDQGGGLLRVNGTHLIDQAVQFLDEGSAIDVFADLRRALSCGDAEDHAKVVLRGGPDDPTIDIELTNANAFPQDRWLVMGTAGTLRGTPTSLEWKTVDWSAMPKRELDPRPFAAGREYAKEDVPWVTHRWEGGAERHEPYLAFYEEFFTAARSGGRLSVTPQSVRRTIDAVNRAYEQADAWALEQAAERAAQDAEASPQAGPNVETSPGA